MNYCIPRLDAPKTIGFSNAVRVTMHQLYSRESVGVVSTPPNDFGQGFFRDPIKPKIFVALA